MPSHRCDTRRKVAAPSTKKQFESKKIQTIDVDPKTGLLRKTFFSSLYRPEAGFQSEPHFFGVSVETFWRGCTISRIASSPNSPCQVIIVVISTIVLFCPDLLLQFAGPCLTGSELKVEIQLRAQGFYINYLMAPQRIGQASFTDKM